MSDTPRAERRPFYTDFAWAPGRTDRLVVIGQLPVPSGHHVSVGEVTSPTGMR